MACLTGRTGGEVLVSLCFPFPSCGPRRLGGVPTWRASSPDAGRPEESLESGSPGALEAVSPAMSPAPRPRPGPLSSPRAVSSPAARPGLSRRAVLGALGALPLIGLVGCGGSGDVTTAFDTTKAWRLSTRGKRASNAAKDYAANKRFATLADALLGGAHPGDTSVPVPLDVSPTEWARWFSPPELGGAVRRVVDLRSLQAP